MIKHLQNILTQNNLCTADPVYVVYQKRQIVVPSGYSDNYVMRNIRDCEAEMDAKEFEDLQIRQNLGEEVFDPYDNKFNEYDWEEEWYSEIDRFCTACFTRAGAEDYIRANGHNLREPFIFVESGHRNKEWQDIRAGLIKLAKKELDSEFANLPS